MRLREGLNPKFRKRQKELLIMTITVTTRYSYGQLAAEVHSETKEELVSTYEFGDSDYDNADDNAVYAYTSQLPVMLTNEAVEELVDEYRTTDAYNDAYHAYLKDVASDSVNVAKVFENEKEAKAWVAPFVKAIIKHSGREAIDGGNRDWLQKNNDVEGFLNANFGKDGIVALALINYIF